MRNHIDKKNTKFLKISNFINKKLKINLKNHDRTKAFNLKITYPKHEISDNNIIYKTQNIEDYSHSSYYKQDKNYNPKKTNSFLNKISIDKNILKHSSYSQEKTVKSNKLTQSLTLPQKKLFKKGDSYNNNNIYLGKKYITYDSETINSNKKKSNITNLKTKYTINTSQINFFNNSNNSLNNNNNKNNSIKNYINNTFNNNSNNNIINNININIKESSYNLNNISDLYRSLKYNYSNDKNGNKMHHFSHSNMSRNFHTEIKNQYHKSKLINLKDSIQLTQKKIKEKFNYFKPVKSNFSLYIRKKKELLTIKNNIYLTNSVNKKIFQYTDKKDKDKNENKLNYRNKKLLSEFITNSKSQDSNKKSIIRGSKSQSLSINKRNSKFRYKYLKNMKMISRNNFSKLEIFHTKSSNSNRSLNNFSRKNNKNIGNYNEITSANHSIKIIKNISQNNIVNNIINNKQTIKEIFRRPSNLGKNVLSKMTKKECEICHKFIDSHLFKIHYNSHPSQIFKWLYLGSFTNACDIKELRKNKINYILNCAFECHNKNLPKDIKELHLKIKDSEYFDLISYFEESNKYINKCKLEGGTLLVHCKLGVSRSASFVIAYLIKSNKLTVEKAMKFLKQKRNQIKPNEGFLNQLHKYEKLIHSKKS